MKTIQEINEKIKKGQAVVVTAEEIFTLVNEFQHGSKIYLATHGTHSAALCSFRSNPRYRRNQERFTDRTCEAAF